MIEMTYVICWPGGPFWEKLCPRAVLKTEGKVFPNKDLPRPANNVFIFFVGKLLYKKYLC